MNTFLKYLNQNAILEAELAKAKAELEKAGAVERSLAARAASQSLVINSLMESHPQIAEIDRIFAEAMVSQRRRRSQIQMLKLEVEHTRKRLVSDSQKVGPDRSRTIFGPVPPDRSPVIRCYSDRPYFQ